ncbi:hypothetical protein LOTGIDRAFT_219403 [Lottia gigantea]|uniref:Transporter n=1 Tax=Lottia gigantea TaxID=225164 RepID=V4A061_LOTGI|nr:hypothetical protein LOTGIDRAFT_219403 [Lottia gigantea]ESO88310.1 hypothetical protein LOTGIDRAFT_219403 [Lottia gigantea]
MEKLALQEESTSTKEVKVRRSQWSRNLDFVLSFLGYTIGPSNIWRFPYLCAKNGGAVFLIPYAVFMLLFGFPLALLELSLGQYSGKSAFAVWDICPALKGIGLAMNAVTVLYGIYYIIILSWVLFYLYNSFKTPLPWTNCDNWWNTADCIETLQTVKNNITLTNTAYNFTSLQSNLSMEMQEFVNDTSIITNGSYTAPEEFWSINLLRMSTGLDDLGDIQLHLVLTLALGWIIIFCCIIKGVETVGKVVYVTAIGPFIILFIILIRAVTLPGAVKGIEYYVIPDFEKLADVQVWIQALMQIFFSMGIGWGAFITLASYNNFNSHVVRNTIVFCIVGEGTSFVAGFVVFAVLGFMSEKAGKSVAEVATAGPGLAFITYPEALSELPLPQLWSVLFFIMLFLLAIDSLFVSLEIIVTAVVDAVPNPTSKTRILVTAVICVLMFFGGLIYTTQAGIYIFQLVDWYIASISVFVITFAECIIVSWIYGVERFSDNIEAMTGRRPPLFVKILWRFITPFILVTAFIFTIAEFSPPTYGSYVYPSYSSYIGWSIAFVTTSPIPIWFIKEINQREGPLLQRIKTAFQPNDNWQPAKAQIDSIPTSTYETATFLVQNPLER